MVESRTIIPMCFQVLREAEPSEREVSSIDQAAERRGGGVGTMQKIENSDVNSADWLRGWPNRPPRPQRHSGRRQYAVPPAQARLGPAMAEAPALKETVVPYPKMTPSKYKPQSKSITLDAASGAILQSCGRTNLVPNIRQHLKGRKGYGHVGSDQSARVSFALLRTTRSSCVESTGFD